MEQVIYFQRNWDFNLVFLQDRGGIIVMVGEQRLDCL